jgi:predicted secreted protein
MIFGDVFAEKERFVMVFVALGPLAMCSAMVGYAVWWLVMFVLALLGLHHQKHSDAEEPGAHD